MVMYAEHCFGEWLVIRKLQLAAISL